MIWLITFRLVSYFAGVYFILMIAIGYFKYFFWGTEYAWQRAPFLLIVGLFLIFLGTLLQRKLNRLEATLQESATPTADDPFQSLTPYP